MQKKGWQEMREKRQEEGLGSFVKLKQALTVAPTLGLPDPRTTFLTVCVKRMGFMSSVLLHKHGGKLRPEASVSTTSEPETAGLPYYFKPVTAASVAMLASSRLGGKSETKCFASLCSVIDPFRAEYLTMAIMIHYHNVFLTLPLFFRTCLASEEWSDAGAKTMERHWL